jgi:hypothetical protein
MIDTYRKRKGLKIEKEFIFWLLGVPGFYMSRLLAFDKCVKKRRLENFPREQERLIEGLPFLAGGRILQLGYDFFCTNVCRRERESYGFH